MSSHMLLWVTAIPSLVNEVHIIYMKHPPLRNSLSSGCHFFVWFGTKVKKQSLRVSFYIYWKTRISPTVIVSVFSSNSTQYVGWPRVEYTILYEGGSRSSWRSNSMNVPFGIWSNAIKALVGGPDHIYIGAISFSCDWKCVVCDTYIWWGREGVL